MPKYHVKPDGTPGECTAKYGCPYGSEFDHFDSFEKAQEYADECNEMNEILRNHKGSLVLTYSGLKNGSYGFSKVPEEELNRSYFSTDKEYVLKESTNLDSIADKYIKNLPEEDPELYSKLKERFGENFTDVPAISDSVKKMIISTGYGEQPEEPKVKQFRNNKFYELPSKLSQITPEAFDRIQSKVIDSVHLQLYRGHYNEADILAAFNKSSMEDLYKAGDQSIENENYKCTIKWDGDKSWEGGKFYGPTVEIVTKPSGYTKEYKLNGMSENGASNGERIFLKFNKYTNPNRYKDYDFEYSYNDRIAGEVISIKGTREEVAKGLEEKFGYEERYFFEKGVQEYDNITEIEESGKSEGTLEMGSNSFVKIVKRK